MFTGAPVGGPSSIFLTVILAPVKRASLSRRRSRDSRDEVVRSAMSTNSRVTVPWCEGRELPAPCWSMGVPTDVAYSFRSGTSATSASTMAA